MKHTVKGFYTREECIQIRESAKDFSKSHSIGIDGKPKIDGYRNAEIGKASPLRLPDIAKHVLEFNSIESTYKEIEKLESEGQGFNWMANYVGENIGKIYLSLIHI